MERLFGTDGIRGLANRHPMTVEMAVRVGQAIGLYYADGRGDDLPIVIGRDTRLSGDMLKAAVAGGICSAGIRVMDGGILPTPAIAFLARESRALAGVVISASHNPFEDNGIKVFRGNGTKLSDLEETAIESLVQNPELSQKIGDIRDVGTVRILEEAGGFYAEFIAKSLSDGCSIDGMKLVLDCSNGAAYLAAPELFSSLGATLTVLSASPDGRNINRNCGSQHPETLANAVKAQGADLGLAFDGDGDRVIAVDETGTVLSGDQVLAVLAAYLKTTGQIGSGIVVSTVMSNIGLEEALNRMALTHASCQVGDRYVMEKMSETGSLLGGEDSGHIILREHHSTGDGLLSGLKLMEAMKQQGKPLSELARVMTVYPQVLLNVTVDAKPAFESMPRLTAAINATEAQLGTSGRVLVRYSGTEPICRVMVEAPTKRQAESLAESIAQAVQEEIG